MANNRKFTFLKSNYSLRTKHKSLNEKNKSILVRDYMVTTNNGGWDSGTIPYGESNFKMVHRDDVKPGRKHSYGKWVLCGESETWDMSSIKSGLKEYESLVSNDTKMVMKPLYKSLLDFAYFGSCVELIKASITDIVQKYPGELYVTNKEYTYYNVEIEDLTTIKGESGETLYYVDNPFGIDIFTTISNENIENKIKYFDLSRNMYMILDGDEMFCENDKNRYGVEIEPTVNFNCLQEGYIGRVLLLDKNGINDESEVINSGEGALVIYIYYINGKFVYLTDAEWEGYHIRPSETFMNEFYTKQLDDFEAFLLNRESNPRYLIEIETLEYTDEGVAIGNKRLCWPSRIGGWNIDVEGHKYEDYVSFLLKQAEIYDEYYSNNLWRMMTHDSIKNMDLTFSNEKLNEDNYDYREGTSKIEGLFWAYGREFDDLKRYIVHLKSVNTITYNQKNNISDYILSDKLELNGWEVYDPTGGLLPENAEVSNLYPSQFKSYKLSDVKSTFFNELLINSKDIFSRKGTKYGIEMLMSLFGYCSYDYASTKYMELPDEERIKEVDNTLKLWRDLTAEEQEMYYDYKIDEYVVIASVSGEVGSLVDPDYQFRAATYNAMKKNFIGNDEFDYDYDIYYSPYQGLPIREVVIVKSNNEVKKYLIPWFDKVLYKDNAMYFQMYGGWGEVSLKAIDETIHVNTEEHIKFTELVSDTGKGFRIYSETLKYLKTKYSVEDLFRIPYNELTNGDIYYIYNPLEKNSELESHYYVLVDKNQSGNLSGWRKVTLNDFETETSDALKIVYLESLIDDNRGNNPHTGYGKYDNGDEYLEYFRQLFKYEIDNDSQLNPLFNSEAYECNGEINEDIKTYGFNISDRIIDNMKVWYFTLTTLSYEKQPSDVFVYPSTAGQNITVVSGYTINNNSAWRVGCSNYTTEKYHSIIDLYPFEKLDENKIYNVSFTVKNTATSTIVIKIKLGKIPGVTSFASTDLVDSIEMLPNTERNIEFSGYPWPKANLQIWIEPRWTQTGTNKYYPIKYDISKIYLTQNSQIDTLAKNDENGLYYVYRDSDMETNKVGKSAFDEGQVHYEANFSTFDFETQQLNSCSEASANSIINVKNINIEFASKYRNFGNFKNYLGQTILPYITQMIPSTAILSIGFRGVEPVEITPVNAQYADPVGFIKN